MDSCLFIEELYETREHTSEFSPSILLKYNTKVILPTCIGIKFVCGVLNFLKIMNYLMSFQTVSALCIR